MSQPIDHPIATREQILDPVERARDALGNKLVAYCLGLTATSQLREQLDDEATSRLAALEVLLDDFAGVESAHTVQAWLMGSGMDRDEAPAWCLRHKGASCLSQARASASSLITGGFR